jgi:FMN phosphatase YigB (HAD superfamily)
MTSPRAVVFDLGKVLLDFDYHIAARNFSAKSDRTPKQILELLLDTPLLLDYERGLMSEQAFFEAFSTACSYRGDFEEFALHFGDIFAPISEMIVLHAEISQRGFGTYVFSNTNSLAIRHVREAYPFFANFTGYILSYEHRCMKPDPGL